MRSTEDGHAAAQPEPEVELAVFEVPETHACDLVAEALDFRNPDSWLPVATVGDPALLFLCRGCGLSCLMYPWCPTLGLAELPDLPVLWHQAPSDLK